LRTSGPITLAAVLAVSAMPPIGAEEIDASPPAQGLSIILGKVFDVTGKTPVVGATVLAYHLSTEQVYSSSPTNPKGVFEIPDVPRGYYDLAVETAEGLFVGNQVLNVPPDGKAIVHFDLDSFSAPAGQGAREFPGSERPSSGVAQVDERPTQKDFWSSTKGIAILGSIGGVGLLLLASDSGDDEPSPFIP
jgi:hypothetical protein